MLLALSYNLASAQENEIVSDTEWQSEAQVEDMRHVAGLDEISQCPDLRSMTSFSMLHYTDHEKVFFRLDKNLENDLLILDAEGNAYPYKTGEYYDASLPLDREYAIVQRNACGQAAIVHRFDTHPYDKEVPIEVSEELMDALEGWPSTMKSKDFVRRDDGVDKMEKLSFIQKQSYSGLPLEDDFDPLAWLQSSLAKTEDDHIPVRYDLARELEPCQCRLVITSNKYLKNKSNEYKTYDQNLAIYWDGTEEKDGALEILQQCGWPEKIYSERRRYHYSKGAGQYISYWQHGRPVSCKPAGAILTKLPYTNVDQIPWPITDTNALIGHAPTDYQSIDYRIQCTNNDLPAECGCTKEVEVHYNFGHRSTIKLDIGGTGSGKSAYGHILLAGVALVTEQGSMLPTIVDAGSVAMVENCGATWDTSWVESTKKFAAGVAGLMADFLDHGSVGSILNNAGNTFGDLIDMMTTSVYTINCGNTLTEKYGTIFERTRTFDLHPNKTTTFTVATYFDLMLKGKKRFNNKIEINTNAGIVTNMSPSSQSVIAPVTYYDDQGLPYSVPHWTYPKNCCSKRYGNWLLSSPGWDPHDDLQNLQNWTESIYGVHLWDYSGPITGNYGRREGPKPDDCDFPIDIPPSVKQTGGKIYDSADGIIIEGADIGSRYTIYNVLGKKLGEGNVRSAREKIRTSAVSGQDHILIIHTRSYGKPLTQKILR